MGRNKNLLSQSEPVLEFKWTYSALLSDKTPQDQGG